jgi:hypothetical protein
MIKFRKIPLSFYSLILSSIITTTAVYAIIQGTEIFPWAHEFVINLAVSMSLGLAVTSSFYTSFYRGLFLKVLNPFSDHRSMISEAAIAQSVILLLFSIGKINASMAFTGVIALQTLTTYCGFAHGIQSLRINQQQARLIPWGAASVITVYGFIVWPTHNFWSIDSMIASSAIWQSLVHAILIPGITLYYAWHPKLRLISHGITQNIKLRLDPTDGLQSPWLLSLVAAIMNLCLGLLIWPIIKSGNGDYPIAMLAAIQCLYLPAMLDAWSRLDKAGSEQKSLRALARFTPKSTIKVFQRYSESNDSWAAAIGLRTSAFTIDHDPDGVIAAKIPASVNILRHEEVMSIVNQIINRHAISLQSISHRVSGILDPENCARPCVQALNLCATLHLDANALIERRLSSLANLLPIINPGLAAHVDSDALSTLLKRSQWFFYFDFSWVDQNIVNTHHSARAGVHFEPISEEIRLKLITHMRRTHSIGNFLWLGKDAHNRLLQEAPNLAPIMEPHSFKNTDDTDVLLFSVKFEQLVPRLQRYYSLEDMRAKIIDYEPTAEAQRLLKILGIQIDNTTSIKERLRIVESIASYNWKGYKEKDQALKLLARVAKEYSIDSSAPNSDREQVTPILCKAIKDIGYPSQLMNQAQMFKLELRTISNLRQHALNTNSSRFEEAWILLGHMDYSRANQQDIDEIRKIIAEACVKQDIMHIKSIATKIVDAVVGLLRRHPSDWIRNYKPELHLSPVDAAFEPERKLLVKIAQKLIAVKSDAETMTLILDAFAFVEQYTGTPIDLPPEIISYFESRIYQTNDESKEWKQSVQHRWQEHKSRLAQQKLNKAG